MKKNLFFMCAVLAIFGCGGENVHELPCFDCEELFAGYTGSYGSLSYGGQTYKTVAIGTQVWMAENLNYNPGTGTSACYGNQASNCTAYGRLYDWETALTVCPSGWHLPSYEEWDILVNYTGGSSTAGRKLKAASGWSSGGNGADAYGFSALPGGYGYSVGSFGGVGSISHWWSASELGSNLAYYQDLHYDYEDVRWSNDGKSNLYSVRCLQGYSSVVPSSSSVEPAPSSSSVAPSSSSAPVFACTMTATAGTVGLPISPAPAATCNGTAVTAGLTWTPASLTPTAAGSVSVSVSASSGVCAGMTAACGSVNVSPPTLTCAMTATTGTVGAAISPAPAVTCNGTAVNANLTWTPANLTPTSTGSLAVSVSASSGVCAGMTAACGSITISAPTLACAMTATAGIVGTAISPAPTVSCNGTAISSGLAWTPANLTPTAAGSVAVSVAVSGGICSDMTKACGNVNVSAPNYGPALNYEGQTYKTVVIGTQTWMAENLNYNPGTGSSACYNNQESNCNTYGRLYDWATAMTVCPSGWHLPTIADWNTLSSYVQSYSGCSSCNARLLKATSGWNGNGNGTDTHGFSALPGGGGGSDGSFRNVGDYGSWWNASDYGTDQASVCGMSYYSGFGPGGSHKASLYSVRCLQDSDGSSAGYTGSYGSVTDGAGQKYKTVVIGTQTWMAENLNYNPGTGTSACYGNESSNCEIYGRLYDWATAMDLPSSCNSSCSGQVQSKHRGICPSGWHLPSHEEFQALVNFIDGGYNNKAGTKLKATTGWSYNGVSGNGTDTYGFSALPGGGSYIDGFSGVGVQGNWWSASGQGDTAFCSNMSSAREVMYYWGEHSKSYVLHSVRCLKD